MSEVSLLRRVSGQGVRLLRWVLVGYLLVVLAMTMIERWLVYPAPPVARNNWTPAGGEHEDVWIESGGGVRVHGWYYHLEGASRAVLYCHGNGEQVADNHVRMRMLRDRLDASVLIFDYRGYGKSDGKPHERGVIADGRAAQRWLAERTGRAPEGVVIVGRSLGGGVATALAAELGAEALVLESTFTRLTDAAASHYPWLPVRLVMRNRYNSLKRIAEYRGPVWISHGDRDRVVPFSHAGRLFQASPSDRKKLVELPGRGHDELPHKGYYSELRSFLDSPISETTE